MERMTRRRAMIILLVFLVIVGLYAFRLYDVQMIQTGGQKDNASTFTTQTSVKAARGEILDRNGNVLVGNRDGKKLTINHYVLLSVDGTYNHLYRLATQCNRENISYNETFPVTRERPFTYTLSEYTSAQQGYFQTFLSNYGIDSDITAPLLVENLRNRYGLPEEWTDEEARQVIGLVYELVLRNHIDHLPVYEFISDADDQALSHIVELNIPGVNVEVTPIREYYTEYGAHILGYVGSMSPEQWDHYKDIDGYQMDTKIGQSGFEAAFEEYLHGVDGLRLDTVTADGTIISSEWLKEPKAGSNVELTIDINLQRVAEEQMAAVAQSLITAGKDGADVEGMAVVAIDPRNGDVLACASYPTYDLQTVFEDYDELMKDPLLPTFNRALMGLYAPGSTYKMNMVVAGIEAGRINSQTKIYDKGIFDKYKDYQPTCLAYPESSHGDITAAEALQVSCNFFFYDLGDRMAIANIDLTAKALGLGEKTGVELLEYAGRRANPETKAALYDSDKAVWSPGDQLAASIGQSDNMFTPIQLAVYAGTLGMQGTRYKSTFLNRVVSPDYRTLVYENDPVIASVFDISDDAYTAYNEGMKLVTSKYGGTAYSTFANYPISVAGKTGTAQHGRGGSENGSFVCYAPADAPQPEIAIAIYGEKAAHGSSLAKIAKSMLDVQFAVGDVAEVITYENKVS